MSQIKVKQQQNEKERERYLPIKKFVTVRSLLDAKTLKMTRILPKMTIILIKTNIMTEIITVALLNFSFNSSSIY